MRNESVIYTHERWKDRPYLEFIADQLGQNGYGAPPTTASAQGTVAAYINHSRWLADCPQPGCGGAVVVSLEQPFFMCPYCANRANGGQWYALLLPDKAERQEIEGILLERPRENRNWYPWETIEQLRAENLVGV